VEDEHGALFEREPAEGSFELVSVVDGQDLVRAGRLIHRQDADLG